MNSTNDHIMDVKKMRKGHLLWPLPQLFVLGLIVGTILYYPATATAGAVSLAWDVPTTNADGSPLTDLAGYEIHIGTSPETYSEVVRVGRVTSHTLYNLSPGQTYFFGVTAYDWSLNESEFSNEVIATIISIPPRASFNYSCADLICSFTDTSTDSDGNVVAWNWDVGGGASSLQQNPEHTYASEGTIPVALSVFDDDAEKATTVQDVSARHIPLSTVGYKVKGVRKADLNWNGATSTNVDIYRNGSKITATANDGSYTDNIDKKGEGTYTYQVCEAGTSTCSNKSTLGETDTSSGGGSGGGSGDGTVTCTLDGSITLSATGYKVKGFQKVDLSWDGAMSTNVDVYRDGSKTTTTANDGSYTDNIDKKGGGTYTYQIYEEGTSTCSNESTVIF